MAGFFSKEKIVNKVVLLPVERISPNPAQPRRDFAEDELRELCESIRENGVLQPITVRRKDGSSYELIAGERRLRASKIAGRTEIPAIILDSTEKQSAVFAILENVQRQDLNMFEEAKALQVLIQEWGVTQEEAARKLGKAQSTVANKLRLLALSEQEQNFLLQNGLTERYARALLSVQPEERMDVLRAVVEKKMNVSQMEQYIQHRPEKPKEKEKRKVIIVKDVRIFLNTINKAIDTMKSAGIPAEAEKYEEAGCIEYRVRIPIGGHIS